MNFIKEDWNGVSSTSLSDAMQGLQTMDAVIKPLNKEMQAVGPAYTVQIVKNDSAVIFQALHEAKPGEVIVIAAQGTTDVAFLGDLCAAMAQQRGLAGIVIDGCIRDSLSISRGTFPVFAKGAVPKIPAVTHLGQVQQPIVCAGVSIRPGDIIFADADGVVAVPKEETATVLEKARVKEEKDQWKMNSIIPNPESLENWLRNVCENSNPIQ